jgi:hypothetical protein
VAIYSEWISSLWLPQNLYNLTKGYFSQRIAKLSTNIIRLEREVSNGCPQVTCCELGFWNIQFNSLLKLEFKARTKAVAFADDLMLALRGNSVSAVENYSNGELSKIRAWAKRNKIRFNDEKFSHAGFENEKERTEGNKDIFKQQNNETSPYNQIFNNNYR